MHFDAIAQSQDTTTASLNTHSPRLATLLSAAVPGAGQLYNKKYYKPPVIYLAGYFMVNSILNNQQEYNRYLTAYKLRVDGDAATRDEFEGVYSEQSLQLLKNNFKRNRDLSYIGLSVVYILNILDAYVDAHLFYFDLGKETSVRLSPQLYPNNNKVYTGVNFSLNF